MKNIFFEEIKEIVKKPLDKTEPNLIKQNLSAEELFYCFLNFHKDITLS